jgi:hypothetical protein
MYAMGGSLFALVHADITLSNVNDHGTFTSIDVTNDIISIQPSSISEFMINSVGGSLFLSSRFSIALFNANFTACFASTSYDGANGDNITFSMSAIGGAAALLSGSNPFFEKEKRKMFQTPSVISLRAVHFSGNRASCVRNLALNSFNSSAFTVLGGAVAMLHSNLFGNFNNRTEAKHDQIISLEGVNFSNNNLSAVFPSQKYEPKSALNLSAVALGGSL